MSPAKARQIIQQYRHFLRFIPKKEGPVDSQPTPREALGHTLVMLDKMERFLDQTEACHSPGILIEAGWGWDKFNRWLGFIQGIFWLHGDFTLDQLKEHNRLRKE